jgi:preprotein translocase subunit YajC
MHPRPSSRRLAGALAAVLALALLGTHAAAAKTATGGHPARVAGTVSAVDATAGTLTITPAKAPAVTLQTNAQTRLSLDGEPAKLADVPAGAAARALYDSRTKLALRIEVRSVPTLAAVAGKVTAVTSSSLTIAPEEGSAVTLETDASTKIVLDGAPSTLSAIAVGDQSRGLYDITRMVAAAIEAESPHHCIAEIEGKVTAVTSSSLTIAP